MHAILYPGAIEQGSRGRRSGFGGPARAVNLSRDVQRGGAPASLAPRPVLARRGRAVRLSRRDAHDPARASGLHAVRHRPFRYLSSLGSARPLLGTMPSRSRSRSRARPRDTLRRAFSRSTPRSLHRSSVSTPAHLAPPNARVPKLTECFWRSARRSPSPSTTSPKMRSTLIFSEFNFFMRFLPAGETAVLASSLLEGRPALQQPCNSVINMLFYYCTLTMRASVRHRNAYQRLPFSSAV